MFFLAWLCVLDGATATGAGTAAAGVPGPFVQSLWMLQSWGLPDADIVRNDKSIKATLAKSLGKDIAITFDEVQGLISQESFQKLAGADRSLSVAEIGKAVEGRIPASRQRLNAPLRKHLDYLTTTYDMVEQDHRDHAARLCEWIVANYSQRDSLQAIVVCTGNSRRSIMTASMGNAAAAYYGLDKVHFHSGGTAPTAFNKRTIAALQAIGFEVQSTGQEAPRGEAKTANPMFTVKWGTDLQVTEFSKKYSDAANPQEHFAALMVCTEADAECPVVKGAELRLSMPFLDPKSYDESEFESAKYAERRDDIGRTMLSAFAQAALKLR